MRIFTRVLFIESYKRYLTLWKLRMISLHLYHGVDMIMLYISAVASVRKSKDLHFSATFYASPYDIRIRVISRRFDPDKMWILWSNIHRVLYERKMKCYQVI